MRIPIRIKDVIHSRPSPNNHRAVRLPQIAHPQGIILLKALFKRPLGIQFTDSGLRAPAIAGVDSYCLTQHFFDGREEGGVFWVGERGEGMVSGGEAAEQRAAVVRLWERDAVVCCQGAPEGVGVGGLGDAGRGQEGVGPGDVAVAVSGGPVALC